MSLDLSYTYQSCDEEHIPWVSRICLEILIKKIEELHPVREKHMRQMKDLLRWKPEGVFMRPQIVLTSSSNGLTSWQVFHDHETLGVSLPDELEDPENLLDLLQSRCVKEFTITEWLDTYHHRDQYPIWPEEYLSHPGMNEQLFQTLFHRKPEPALAEHSEAVSPATKGRPVRG